jgi:hypothetical protein
MNKESRKRGTWQILFLNSSFPAFLIKFFAGFAFIVRCHKIPRDAAPRKPETQNPKLETTCPSAPFVVRQKRPRPPLAPHSRSLRDLGFRNHAATNAGQNRDTLLGPLDARVAND